MSDEMVLTTQKWLNKTYGNVSNFKQVTENGRTGWPKVYALIQELQYEIGIDLTTNTPATPAVISAIYFALFGVR